MSAAAQCALLKGCIFKACVNETSGSWLASSSLSSCFGGRLITFSAISVLEWLSFRLALRPGLKKT